MFEVHPDIAVKNPFRAIYVGDETLSEGGPGGWNELPYELNTITNLATFHTKCKVHFSEFIFSNINTDQHIYLRKKQLPLPKQAMPLHVLLCLGRG